MMGETYRGKSMSALFGPAHSTKIPENLWGAWLDSSLEVLGVTHARIPHNVFEETSTGVTNNNVIDGGTIPAGTIAYFAFMDAEEGGSIVWYGAVTFPETPTEDDPFAFSIGDLVIPYEDPA